MNNGLSEEEQRIERPQRPRGGTTVERTANETIDSPCGCEPAGTATVGRSLRVLVAEDDGRIVGALVLAIVENITRKGTPYAIIENVVVDEDARGQRHGEALIEQAVEEARQAGCYKVSLTSNKRRSEAHRCYERLGFVQTHEAFRIDL